MLKVQAYVVRSFSSVPFTTFSASTVFSPITRDMLYVPSDISFTVTVLVPSSEGWPPAIVMKSLSVYFLEATTVAGSVQSRPTTSTYLYVALLRFSPCVDPNTRSL